MSIKVEGELKFPDNLGCTYGDSEGKFCATVGCYAETLRKNLQDIGDTSERWQRDGAIVNEAKEKGCPNV